MQSEATDCKRVYHVKIGEKRTWSDDGEHTQTPSPKTPFSLVGNKMGRDISTDPSLDEPRGRRDERSEKSTSKGRQIGDDNLNHDGVHGESDLENDNTTSVGCDTFGRSFDDGTDTVEDDGGDEHLDSTHDIGDLGSDGLTSGTDNTLENTHGDQKRVGGERAGSISLKDVSDGLLSVVVIACTYK